MHVKKSNTLAIILGVGICLDEPNLLPSPLLLAPEDGRHVVQGLSDAEHVAGSLPKNSRKITTNSGKNSCERLQ